MNGKAIKQKVTGSRTSLLVRASQAALGSLALLVAAVVLAVALYLTRGLPEPVLPGDEVMTQTLYEGYASTIVSELGISQRPLFWQERRPLPEEEVVVEEEPVQEENRNIDNFQLVGLFNAGESSSVIVMYKDKKHRLRVNDELAGWTLVGIGDNKALFQGGGSQGVESKALYEPVLLPEQWPGGDSLLNNQSDF